MSAKMYDVLDIAKILRKNGIAVSTSEVMDAVVALSFFQNIDDDIFFDVVLCTLIKGRSAYFSPDLIQVSSHSYSIKADKTVAMTDHKGNFLLSSYSPLESRGAVNLGDIDRSEYLATKRALKKVSRTLASLPGRRTQSSMKGYLSLRRMIRSSLSTGTVIMKLKKSKRKATKSRIFYLFDVSGSMGSYYAKLLELMKAASEHGSKVFAFSTELVRLDMLLSGTSLERAREIVSHFVPIWGSGTRIGDALKSLLSIYRGEFTKKTVLIIVSDGLDRGGVQELSEALGELKNLTERIIWLNPLADDDAYEPATEGMQAALPYISRLAGLERVLRRPGILY